MVLRQIVRVLSPQLRQDGVAAGSQALADILLGDPNVQLAFL